MRGLFAKLLLVLSVLKRRLRKGEPPAPVGSRTHKRRRPAANPPYDLAKDASTDNQKYLM